MEPDFQRILEALPGQVLVLAPDGPRFTILAASDAYLRATLTERSEIIGRGFFEVFPDSPDDPETRAADAARTSFQRVVDERRPDAMGIRRYDVRRPEAEGGSFEKRYWRPLSSPVLSDDGRVTCIIHQLEDVTEAVLHGDESAELRAANIALRESSAALAREISGHETTMQDLERYRLLLTSSLEAQKDTILFSIDHDYRYLYFNRAQVEVMKRAYGADVEIGACVLDYITDAGDRAAAKENYDRALAGESHTNVRVFGDVERAYYESFFNPVLDESGKIIGATGLARDITARKQGEQELQQSRALLQAAMDRSQAGIAIADAPDGRLRYVNKAGLFIRGGSEAEIVDQVDAARYVETWHILHHDGTPYAPDEVPLARAVLYGETSEAEFIVRRDDHEDRIVLARAAPIRDAEGAITAGVVVFHDITERKHAEDEVGRLNAELEERVVTRTAQLEATNRELEAFAYSVSHDLRAPLRAIDGFSAMVAEDAAERLTAADVEHLQRVRDAAQRMGLLIDDLLGLSRVGRQDLILASVDLSGLAAEVLAELRREQPEREVDVVIAPHLRANADPTLLRVILVNLLGNAWKFTSKHETARIEVGAGEADGECVFFVRDDGAGFDTRHARNLFGAFQRMHSPGEFEGTGIGLATVQRLVTRHGGRVWAEAEVEKGATFYFTLSSDGAPST